MKKWIFIACFFLTGTVAFSQALLSSTITLAVEDSAGNTNNFFPAKAIFSLNDDSKQFDGLIDIFPAVPNPDAEDSIAQFGKPLQLKLTGIFPMENMDFYTVADNGKSGTMELTCSLNDITIKKTLTFYLVIPENAPEINDAGYPHYQGRVSFSLPVLPGDFNLDSPPFSIKKNILVDVSAGIVNKTY